MILITYPQCTMAPSTCTICYEQSSDITSPTYPMDFRPVRESPLPLCLHFSSAGLFISHSAISDHINCGSSSGSKLLSHYHRCLVCSFGLWLIQMAKLEACITLLRDRRVLLLGLFWLESTVAWGTLLLILIGWAFILIYTQKHCNLDH